MHQVIQMTKTEDCRYVLTSLQDTHLSNRDYIRRAFRKVFPSQDIVQGFGLACTPTASYQSLNPNLTVIWENEAVQN